MKRTPLRKIAKKHTPGWWKKELWKVFSLYIRERDNYTCFTCGRVGKGSGMHAGHLIPRAAGGLALYFNEYNTAAQCYYCNINLGGNGAEYYRKAVEKYGEEVVAKLFWIKDNEIKKYSIEDYQILIDKYKNKIEELKHERLDRK